MSSRCKSMGFPGVTILSIGGEAVGHRADKLINNEVVVLFARPQLWKVRILWFTPHCTLLCH